MKNKQKIMPGKFGVQYSKTIHLELTFFTLFSLTMYRNGGTLLNIKSNTKSFQPNSIKYKIHEKKFQSITNSLFW